VSYRGVRWRGTTDGLLVRRGEFGSQGERRTRDVELPLEHGHWVEHADSVVIAMIDGTIMVGQRLLDVTMNNGRPRYRLVDMHGRRDAQGEYGG
jgi:hypothetical protein